MFSAEIVDDTNWSLTDDIAELHSSIDELIVKERTRREEQLINTAKVCDDVFICTISYNIS